MGLAPLLPVALLRSRVQPLAVASVHCSAPAWSAGEAICCDGEHLNEITGREADAYFQQLFLSLHFSCMFCFRILASLGEVRSGNSTLHSAVKMPKLVLVKGETAQVHSQFNTHKRDPDRPGSAGGCQCPELPSP